MSKGQRKRLFELFSAQLPVYDKKVTGGVVICPHCGRYIDSHGLDERQPDDRRISIAHVLPSSLGGRRVVIACAKDNNSIGHSFEADLVKLVAVIKAHNGDGKVRSKIRFPNVSRPIPVNYYRSDDGKIQFDIYKTLMSPTTAEQMGNYLESAKSGGGLKLNLDLPTGNMKRAQRAVVIIAHLKLFWGFGYEYLLSPSLNGIHKWISSDEDVESPPVAFVDIHCDKQFQDDEIVVVPKGEKNGFFLVPVIRPTPNSVTLAAVIPGPKMASVKLHQEMGLDAISGTDWAGSGECVRMPGPENFTKEKYRFIMHRIWADIIESQ